ncbi:hypothetical protein CFN79_12425 [Chromobacterium vaccinii]|nr:hypothetical protein CFN79_12425 [Chromobacterium vaccinii]
MKSRQFLLELEIFFSAYAVLLFEDKVFLLAALLAGRTWRRQPDGVIFVCFDIIFYKNFIFGMNFWSEGFIGSLLFFYKARHGGGGDECRGEAVR